MGLLWGLGYLNISKKLVDLWLSLRWAPKKLACSYGTNDTVTTTVVQCPPPPPCQGIQWVLRWFVSWLQKKCLQGIASDATSRLILFQTTRSTGP
jgi:hypothetical protein